MALLKVDDEYLKSDLTVRPGDRLHRLLARLFDSYIDDITDADIETLEEQIDVLRLTHADGQPIARAGQC